MAWESSSNEGCKHRTNSGNSSGKTNGSVSYHCRKNFAGIKINCWKIDAPGKFQMLNGEYLQDLKNLQVSINLLTCKSLWSQLLSKHYIPVIAIVERITITLLFCGSTKAIPSIANPQRQFARIKVFLRPIVLSSKMHTIVPES